MPRVLFGNKRGRVCEHPHGFVGRQPDMRRCPYCDMTEVEEWERRRRHKRYREARSHGHDARMALFWARHPQEAPAPWFMSEGPTIATMRFIRGPWRVSVRVEPDMDPDRELHGDLSQDRKGRRSMLYSGSPHLSATWFTPWGSYKRAREEYRRKGMSKGMADYQVRQDWRRDLRIYRSAAFIVSSVRVRHLALDMVLGTGGTCGWIEREALARSSSEPDDLWGLVIEGVEEAIHEAEGKLERLGSFFRED